MTQLKIAARSLFKSPGFTLVCVFSVALGVGVNTAMYSVVDVLLFRRLPYPHPGELVRLIDVSPRGPADAFSWQDLDDVRGQTDVFASVGGGAWHGNTIALPGRAAEQIQTINVTGPLLTTLGIQPMLGRAFTAEELTPGHGPVVIISCDLWQRRFGGQRDVVGQTVRLSGEPVTIIGVMPPSADFRMLWGRVDAWRPVHLAPDLLVREKRLFVGLARLKPGVTPAQAEARLRPLAVRLAHDYPNLNGGHRFGVTLLAPTLIDRDTRRLSWTLLGFAGFVLLIACANLANLQLARATRGARELAVRSALGASRGQLVLHQLTESVVLALSGSLLGLVLANAMMVGISHNAFLSEEFGLQLRLDGGVFAAAMLFGALVVVLSGLIPAWLVSRIDIGDALKQQGGRSTAGRCHQRLRHTLIIVEFALALTLLAGASVMMRGFDAFFARSHGWDPSRLLTAEYYAPEETRYNVHEKRRALHRKLDLRLHAIPGVKYAVIASALPILTPTAVLPIQIDGITSAVPTEQPVASYTMATNDFFAALRIPLLEGNLFPADPPQDEPQLVVINEAMARHFWPGASAIGKRVASWNQGQLIWREVIGVVGNVELAGNPAFPGFPFQIYRPLVQEPWMTGYIVLSAPNPATFKRELERAVMEVDPDIAVENIQTVPEVIAQGQRYYQLLRESLGWFASLGLVLAAVGLFGVISHLVAQRTPEFGIRFALGATAGNVFRLVLGMGVRLTLIGFVFGLVGAIAAGRILAAMVPGLEHTDVTGVLFVSMLLLGVALLASWWPAYRATRVDPLIALRSE